jgi:TetR/AcrR family transcriptional repressor of bet genes
MHLIDWCYNQSIVGRRSVREQRRAEITRALARVLAAHGQGGATMAAVAAEAGIAPGLLHHHFAHKQDLYAALLDRLVLDFRGAVASSPDGGLDAYALAALSLDGRSDVTAARAWVGLFSEALADPTLFAKMRRVMDAEIAHVERLAGGDLSAHDAGAVVAFVVGALVLGSFAPRKTAGFAAPALQKLVEALRPKAGRGTKRT